MLAQCVLGVHFQGQKAPQTPSLLNSFSIPAQMKIVRFKWNEPAFASRGPSMRFSTKTRLGYKYIHVVVIYSVLRRYNIDVCFDKEFGFENCRSLRSPKKSKEIQIHSISIWRSLRSLKKSYWHCFQTEMRRISRGEGDRFGQGRWDEETLSACAYNCWKQDIKDNFAPPGHLCNHFPCLCIS